MTKVTSVYTSLIFLICFRTWVKAYYVWALYSMPFNHLLTGCTMLYVQHSSKLYNANLVHSWKKFHLIFFWRRAFTKKQSFSVILSIYVSSGNAVFFLACNESVVRKIFKVLIDSSEYKMNWFGNSESANYCYPLFQSTFGIYKNQNAENCKTYSSQMVVVFDCLLLFNSFKSIRWIYILCQKHNERINKQII